MLCYAMQEKSRGYAERKKKTTLCGKKEKTTLPYANYETHVIHHQ